LEQPHLESVEQREAALKVGQLHGRESRNVLRHCLCQLCTDIGQHGMRPGVEELKEAGV
jgi:hypothetical protein